jgi:O-antigen ligase
MQSSHRNTRASGIGGSLAARLTSGPARFAALATLVAAAFLMGGSARPDVQSLVVLRPLAIVLGAYAALLMTREQWRSIRLPALFLLAFAALAALQLVPLPPQLWTGLPGRAVIADLGAAMGLGDAWRPLSLAPERTINALFALSVPGAALLLFAVQREERRRTALALFVWAAVGSALLGVLQISGPADGPFYTYRITNQGNAVGFFANRNHHGVFLACMVLVSTWYVLATDRKDERAPLLRAFGVAAVLLSFVMVLAIGSRAGLAALAVTSGASLWLIARSDAIPHGLQVGNRRMSRNSILIALGTALAALVGLAIFQGRSLSIDRLVDSVGGADQADMRSDLAPVLWRMIAEQFPWGSGFGSFEDYYRVHEPVELLSNRYLNQAHNDWAQWAIEGGLPALLLLALFLAWLARRAALVVRAAPHPSRQLAQVALIVLIMLGLGSVVDYPLRTPAVAVFATILVATLESWARGRRRQQSR